MDIEQLRSYCLSKRGSFECMPFDDETLVMKVASKMFALIPTNVVPASISLKCDPERAVEYRESYDAIKPGYHLNKQHWNTVTMDGTIPDELVREMIDQSYELVFGSLKVRERRAIDEQ